METTKSKHTHRQKQRHTHTRARARGRHTRCYAASKHTLHDKGDVALKRHGERRALDLMCREHLLKEQEDDKAVANLPKGVEHLRLQVGVCHNVFELQLVEAHGTR